MFIYSSYFPVFMAENTVNLGELIRTLSTLNGYNGMEAQIRKIENFLKNSNEITIDLPTDVNNAYQAGLNEIEEYLSVSRLDLTCTILKTNSEYSTNLKEEGNTLLKFRSEYEKEADENAKKNGKSFAIIANYKLTGDARAAYESIHKSN
jgi:hypothetical protein